MPDNPNKISHFWQELKRRNVVRVITVYAGAAFVIIELINNITEPLRLPEWTPTLVIVLLAIGFPVVIIFSWIYDVRPEGGMVKTEPAGKGITEAMPKSYKGWKVASYISFAVIAGLIVLNIIPRTSKKEVLDKSILVLPFINESSDEQNTYFINGIMEAILNNLCKIEDLKVPARTEAEQYRGVARPIPEIAKEMNVSYVLEGSGQKMGNRIVLTVQLINGLSGLHIWSKPYDRVIEKIEDLIDIQAEIAMLVATEIEATITPKEKSIIENRSTTSLAAYDYYMKAEDCLRDYKKGMGDTALLSRAERLYLRTKEEDPDFARAYTGLAKVYWEKNQRNQLPNQDLIKKGNEYLEKAFYLDDQLDEVYIYRGKFSSVYGDTVNAIEQFNLALGLNPNSWEAYFSLGHLYFLKDQKKTLENLLKAADLYRGPDTETLLTDIGNQFAFTGFYDQSKKYFGKALELNNDTLGYLFRLALNDCWRGNYKESISQCKDILNIDSTYYNAIDRLAYDYQLLKEPDRAYPLYKEYENYYVENDQGNLHRLAYVYSEVGEKEKANEFFDQVEQYKLQEVELKKTTQYFAIYDLAGIYTYRGDRQKALEYLNVFGQIPRPYEWIVTLFKNDPLFDSIRDEPEFQQIFLEVESKYQAEHDRIRRWLEESGRL